MIKIFVSLFCASFIEAQPLDSLLESQSLQDLLSYEKEVLLDEELLKSCRRERRHQVFPKSCFQHLWQSVSWAHSSQNWKKKKRDLNRLCVLRRKEISSLKVIEEMKTLPFLSKSCRQSLIEQEKDLLYIINKEKWSEY